MSLSDQFVNHINKNNLFHGKDKLLLAVSGGVDSVVLAALCKQAGYDFSMAHCNFQLRGADSGRDEKFVRSLAEKYAVPFHLAKFNTSAIAQERKISTQEAARDLRYEWFEEVRKTGGYNYILTAHHADDNIETVTMNFFRGSGIKGIRGIESKHGFIVRPLLFARRAELESFLAQQQLEYVNDYTNQTDDYTRNYFRNQVIPFIQKSFPEVNENILANISRFKEAELLYKQALGIHKKKLLLFKGKEVHIPVLNLKKTEPLHTIIYEIIREYHFSAAQVGEVAALLESDTGKYVASSSHRVIKNRNWLIIAPAETGETDIISIDEPGICLPIAIGMTTGNLQIDSIPASAFQLSTSNFVACLDLGEIKFPLLVRKWKQGDYFYPLGMRKKKKLARFFIDQKLSKTDKEQALVIEMNKKIIWIIGHRIDDRFKITDKTDSVLKISVEGFS